MARVADELASGIVCRAVTAGLLDQVFSDGAVIESERGPRSAASLHRMKAAVRAFFAWAAEAGVVDDNPARSIRMHRLPRKLPVFLTAAEKKRLLKELKGRTDFSALRDRAMIEVLLGTGIRLGELAALDMDDIDLDAKHLRVRAGLFAGEACRPPVAPLDAHQRREMEYLGARLPALEAKAAALLAELAELAGNGIGKTGEDRP